MKAYTEMSKEELQAEAEALRAAYKKFQDMGLNLDMSRGKPCKEQLELAMPMMDVLNSGSVLQSADGTDCRNYGVLDGIVEAKALLAGMLGTAPENVIVYGNSSLNIMYDSIARAMLHGIMGHTPWCRLDKVKFLCPAPGYDRHFAITESFGIEMLPVPMSESGPDMDMVERLVAEDESIKGIWCVPKYSNPQGYSYSEETVERMAALKPKAGDFRIFWDNAYAVHHLYEDRQDKLADILAVCAAKGNPDLVYEFVSTSKVSFSGGGIAGLASSAANLADIKAQLKFQTIGHDKLNQLRHVRYFKDAAGVAAHMKKHAALIRPKFDIVLATLEEKLGGLGAGSWTRPNGGYFISFETMPGCARAVVAKAKEAGVVMTGAGAAWPYGKDPQDSNIRIAPTFPSVDELKLAAELFTVCVRLVSVEKLLSA